MSLTQSLKPNKKTAGSDLIGSTLVSVGRHGDDEGDADVVKADGRWRAVAYRTLPKNLIAPLPYRISRGRRFGGLLSRQPCTQWTGWDHRRQQQWRERLGQRRRWLWSVSCVFWRGATSLIYPHTQEEDQRKHFSSNSFSIKRNEF